MNRLKGLFASTALVLGLASACSHGVSALKNTDGPEFQVKQGKSQYTILAFGDFGLGFNNPSDPQVKVGQAMSRSCRTYNCDFAIGLGDNFYMNGVKSPEDPFFDVKFEKPYKDLTIPFFMSLGNHDYLGNVDAQIQYKSARWHLPARYYKVPHLPEWLNLFALDTNDLSSEQLDAVRKEMCSAHGWKGLYGHHPIISNGVHGDNLDIKRKLLPIIKECKVNLLFFGHDHSLESITTDLYDEIISGAAAGLSEIKKDVHRKDSTQNFAASRYGFVLVTIDQKSALIRFFNDRSEVIFTQTIQQRN